jgi:hypothetical protein
MASCILAEEVGQDTALFRLAGSSGQSLTHTSGYIAIFPHGSRNGEEWRGMERNGEAAMLLLGILLDQNVKTGPNVNDGSSHLNLRGF